MVINNNKMPHIITTPSNADPVFHDKSNAHADHHFSFLDEMEAPMWADLALECKLAYEDKDDEWFNISHPCHQLSSRELIASMSGSNEGLSKLDFGITGTKSPKLPSSVSKSRGKDFKSRDWGKDKHKMHPVKNFSKGSLAKFGSLKVVKDGSYRTKVKEPPLVRSGSHKESSLTESGGANSLNSVSSSAAFKNRANSIASRIVDSHSASTITAEDTEQHQQKSVDVSSHVLGRRSELLSAALSITLRKSCVTRQASRYKVNHGRQSEGRNSWSSKSSVGSSCNPGPERKDLTARSSKDKTPESRDTTRASQALNDKVLHQRRCVLVPHKTNANIAAATKTKEVKDDARYSKVARPGKENEAGKKSIVQKSTSRHKHPTTASKAKEKKIAGHSSGTLGGPKPIAERQMGLSQKSSTLEKGMKDTIPAVVNTNRRGLQKSRMEKLAHKGRPSGGITEVKSANAAGKVYLR